MLNRTFAFTAKRLQGLSITIRTEGALGAIGLWTAVGYIDKMKLFFVGNLCCFSPDYLHKKIFIRRLCSHVYRETDASIGFVRDIIALLKQYNLYTYLEEYMLIGYFSTKPVWRTLVINSIANNQERAWKVRMSQKPELTNLNRMHPHLEPLFHWVVARRNPLYRVRITNLVNLLCGNIPTVLMSTIVVNEIDYTCRLCEKSIKEVGFHFITECSATNTERDIMWDDLTDLLTVSQVSQLYNMDNEDIYDVLISAYYPFLLEDDNLREQFVLLVSDEVFITYKKINNALRQLNEN